MVTPNNASTDSAVVSAPPPERALPDNLHDALGLFVIEKKNLKNSKKSSMDGHQEILRFIDWYGRDRKIQDLSPSLVEEYAREFFPARGGRPEAAYPPSRSFSFSCGRWTGLK